MRFAVLEMSKVPQLLDKHVKFVEVYESVGAGMF